MKNITVSVAEDVYAAARRKAAEQKTSVSKLVSAYLAALSREDELREERKRRLQVAFEVVDRRTQNNPVGRFQREACYDPQVR